MSLGIDGQPDTSADLDGTPPGRVADGELGGLAADLATASMALARRFFAGATLWCWSPRWPQHAQHVAVEFVHPVIVGKRALPAEAVNDPDPIATLRTLTRPGDVLLVVAGAGDPQVRRALRRAPAWGLETLWVGAGTRPPTAAADHVLWLTDHDEDAVHTGDVVLLYHVLWELTHVCFEHPGLLVEPAGDECTEEVCITCSDEATLGEVRRVDGADVTVQTARGVDVVDGSLVGPLSFGDLVLVHAGIAIDRLAEDEAGPA